MADVDTFLDGTGVKSAVVLNDVISLDEQLCPKPSG